jgi:hypothetical protein
VAIFNQRYVDIEPKKTKFRTLWAIYRRQLLSDFIKIYDSEDTVVNRQDGKSKRIECS